jgi:hypothetical protein
MCEEYTVTLNHTRDRVSLQYLAGWYVWYQKRYVSEDQVSEQMELREQDHRGERKEVFGIMNKNNFIRVLWKG